MEVGKRSSKGGFLQLFDWNLKSRKKLFSNKSEFSENGNHGKEYVDSLAVSRIQQVHENGPESKGVNDLHYQASVSASEEYGHEAKAPGVVARLMGLEFMPSSNASEYNILDEDHIVIYESALNKANRMPKNPLELKLQKMQKPIERFQSEVLPSKTAKPASVSHNRLMSPIKSPGFVPPKNAAFVMEAAARIIEQSPTKHVRRQPREKGDMQLTSKGSTVRQSLKTNDKSAPLSDKSKSTIQRGDGSRTSRNPKVSSIKNQAKSRKSIGKNSSSSRSSDALKQNNQKQNCTTSEDEEGLITSTSNRKDITRANKVVNKIIVNPTARSGVTDSRRESLELKTEKSSRKKLPENGLRGNSVKRNVSFGRRNDFDVVDKKNGLDVVSFTFTSPIKKSLSVSCSSTQAAEKNARSCLISGENNRVSKFSGSNEVGGDALSILLEQKLKELTSNVEDTLHHQVSEMTSTSSDQRSSCKSVSLTSEGSKWCSSFENDVVSGRGSTSSSRITDVDLDLADSACSSSADSTSFSTLATSKEPYQWELRYIKRVINFADLMFEEFALGHVHRVMDPSLFDQLETHITESNKNLEEQFRVARRALFDCVDECLQSRCKRNFCGSFRAWSKWMVVFKRSDHLAEDLYREIFGFTNMVDLMVDELVEKDMSSHDGRWVEFERETFEEGMGIENEILTSLVEELVSDIFVPKDLC